MMIKRLVPLFLLAAFFFFSRPVQAYIDPATTSYLIQIVSALVITLGVSFGLFFNRIRIFFMNGRIKLAQAWIRISRPGQVKETRTRRTRLDQESPVDKAGFLFSDQRPYRQRLALAGLLVAALSFSLWLFGPLEILAGNPADFAFPFTALLPGLLLGAGLSLLIALPLALIKGRVFDGLLSLGLGLLLASYIQANFLNRGLGKLTGDAIAWEGLVQDMLVNLLIWGLILLLPLAIRLFYRRGWSFLVRFLPALLLAVQLISGLVLLAREPALVKAASQSYLSTQGLYEVAREDNILVFILDRLDNRYIDGILARHPGYLDRLDGFTRFTNNSSRYSQTFPSITDMLTGQPHYFEEASGDYMKKAWKESPFLPGLIDQGYQSRLYLTSSQAYREAQDLECLTLNLARGRIKAGQGALGEFFRLSLYRSGPLALKPFFWTSTDRFDKLVTSQQSPPPYRMDDPAFYRELQAQGLTLSEEKKAFTFIHLQGPHAPYNMDDKGQEVEVGQSSSLLQTMGCFHILFDYFDRLKALDLYQDATIIITGDHGARSSDTRLPEAAMATGLFVKPAGQAGSPLVINPAPVSSDNFQATIYQAAGLDASAYGRGYFDVSPHEFVVRLVYHRLYASDSGPARLLTYQIVGDANDFDDWILVEEKELK